MKGELADECDYSREAAFARRFASPEFLGEDKRFRVPWVWDGSTDRVLVMQQMDGASVGGDVIDSLSQEERNEVFITTHLVCTSTIYSLMADRKTDHRAVHEGTL